MAVTRILSAWLFFAALVAGAAVAGEAPAAAAECAECHGEDGMGRGKPNIPVIAGIPAAHIEEAIYAYVDGARRCVREPRMCETVSALSETEVTALAGYFSSLQRGPSPEPFDPALAAEGAGLHERHCAGCHLPPDDPDVAWVPGIPLHGQRSEYLRYAIEAYLSGDREALLPAMEHELKELKPGDLGALVNYYASYRRDQ